jgi:hypothetical protein
MMAPTKTPRDLTGELAFLTRALKAPTLRQSVSRLAERARAENWSHEEFPWPRLSRLPWNFGGGRRVIRRHPPWSV